MVILFLASVRPTSAAAAKTHGSDFKSLMTAICFMSIEPKEEKKSARGPLELNSSLPVALSGILTFPTCPSSKTPYHKIHTCNSVPSYVHSGDVSLNPSCAQISCCNPVPGKETGSFAFLGGFPNAPCSCSSG